MKFHLSVASLLFLLRPGPGSAAPVPPADVLAHLEQTISWYRNVTAAEDSADLSSGQVVRDSVRPLAVKALQLAFDSARAQAALQHGADAGTNGANPEASGRMQQVLAKAADRVARAQAAIDDLDAKAAQERGRSRDTIVARRKHLVAQLAFARQVQQAVQSLATFADGAESEKDASSELTAQVNRLARSVPEADRTSQNPPAPVAAAQGRTQSPGRTESGGMFGRAGELFALARTRAQLNQLVQETDALLKGIDRLRNPLLTELRRSVSRSDELATASASQDSEQLAGSQRELEALTSRFKQLSAAVIPLREQAILVETTRGNLLNWREALGRRYGTVGASLLIRAAALGFVVCLVLVISALWRRMTFRYVGDARRRRQFLLVRRIAVTSAIALIVILGFITEIGSLATYAGLLTAGLAVSLQNVILSVVAYFFLIGRYGLRVGDRATIGGVTGDVMDIGLVRIYLMELAGAGTDRHVTGRIVVFSNSVLFQPSAMFKQMPGTEYVWRKVTLILTRESDYQLAESRLMAAVDSVYHDYQESIDRQHAAFERSVDVQVSAPHPEHRLRYSDAGLEFSVRYPAAMRSVGTVDDRVIRALYEAVAKEPRLELAPSGAPKVVES